MKIVFFLLLTILISAANASFEKKGSGASGTGLSMSGAASRVSEFAAITNPSLLSGTPAIDLFYRNHYGIKGLNQVALHSEFSIWSQPLGAGLSRYGNNLYSETELTIATAFRPDSSISIGINISSYFLQIEGYGDAFSAGFGVSLLYQITDQIRIAGIINNLNEPQIGSSVEKIPLSGILAVSYSAIPDVELLIDSYKEDSFDFSYRIGTRISIFSGVNLLSGFRNQVNSFSAGLELKQINYILKYSVDIHPVLNASHALGIGYVF